ncbi:serine/threonine-protein kinase [Mucilaginibacter sp. CSA2-8R]|uniref:serine/threonine protein kinase n=1 Tax=Mucilaginibacter sp. CSA2-8R TaxID=3141542 RepID=UPI00315D4229
MSKVFTITEGLENLGALRTGGQGSVYKGKRQGTLYSAIKLLPTPIMNESEDDRGYRNYQSEVAKLQKVNEQPNPHVVKIRSFGLTDSGSFPFIEMEYIEGPDLSELLQPPHDPVFSLKELIKVADQLADALAHCHKVGVKHGDIKSNNVKYNINTGNYVLLDFGLAILTDEQRRSSVRHAGAIEFMAPEQHEGGQMLPQTDVYSYGVILYELLAGEVPFTLSGNSETGRNAVMLSHLEQAIPDPIAKREQKLPAEWSAEKRRQEMQVPHWLLQLIAKCLEKNPDNRYRDGLELQQAITEGSLMANAPYLTTPQPQSMPDVGTALQDENQRLQNQILALQQQLDEAPQAEQEDDESNVTMSKPLFFLFVFLLVVFMGFSVYSAFFKREPMPAATEQGGTTDTTQIKTDTGAVSEPKTYNPDSISDAVMRKRRRDSIIQSSIDSVRRATQKALEEKQKDSADVQTDTTQSQEE